MWIGHCVHIEIVLANWVFTSTIDVGETVEFHGTDAYYKQST